MPIYEFVCEACGRLTEVMQKLSDPPPASCPECGGGPLARLVSRTTFQLKGGGWYADLYGAPKKKPAPDAGGASTGAAPSTAPSGSGAAAAPASSPAPSGGSGAGGSGAGGSGASGSGAGAGGGGGSAGGAKGPGA